MTHPPTAVSSPSPRHSAFTRFVTSPARRPATTLLIAAILAIASLLCVLRLHPDARLERMFSQRDPAAAALVRVLDQFSAAEELLVFVTLPEEQRDADVPKLLGFAERLDAAVRASPDASSMADAVMYRADADMRQFFEKVLVPNGLFYLDDAAFAAAKQRLTREQMTEQIRRNEAMISAPGPAADALSKAFLQDPLRLHEFILAKLNSGRPFKTFAGTDAFVSEDGRSLLIRVTGKKPPSDLEFCKRFVATMGSIVDSVNGDHLTVEYSGSYAIAAASERGIRRDMIASVSGSVVLLLALFLAAYRRPLRLFALAFTPIALGVLYGFGMYSLISPTLTPMTAVIGGILAGMGIDYSIQFMAHYEAFRAAGQSAGEAAARTTREIGGAMSAAWATSVVGFIAIGSSSVPALRDFALLGSLGLAGAFACALVVHPALLALTDRRGAAVASTQRMNLLPLIHLLLRHGRASIGGSLLILIVAGFIVALPGDRLPLESDLTVMHPHPNPPLDAQEHIARRMGGSPGSLIVYLKADSPEHLLALAHRANDRLTSDAVKSVGVTGTFGLASLLPDPQLAPARLAETGPGVAERVVADFRAAVADSVFATTAYDPYATFLNHLLTRPAAPTIADLLPYRRLAETFLPKSSFARRDLATSPATTSAATSAPTEAITLVFVRDALETRPTRDAVVAAVRGALSDVPGATVTGLGVISHDTEETVRRELPRLVLIAVAVVTLYLAVHFRNLSNTLLAMVPTVISLVLLLAFMRLTGQKLNLINLVALPLLIGIDVDYGIFLVSLARPRRSHEASNSQRVARIEPSTQAIVLSAAATILGFGSLITCSMPAVRSLGVVTAIGIAAALCGILFVVVPAMFRSHGAQR